MNLHRWQLLVLFAVGVVGLVYEIASSSEPRPALLITDLVLVGLLPIDVILERLRHPPGPPPGH